MNRDWEQQIPHIPLLHHHPTTHFCPPATMNGRNEMKHAYKRYCSSTEFFRCWPKCHRKHYRRRAYKKSLACFWNTCRYWNKKLILFMLTRSPAGNSDKWYSRKCLCQWPCFTDTCLSISRRFADYDRYRRKSLVSCRCWTDSNTCSNNSKPWLLRLVSLTFEVKRLRRWFHEWNVTRWWTVLLKQIETTLLCLYMCGKRFQRRFHNREINVINW